MKAKQNSRPELLARGAQGIFKNILFIFSSHSSSRGLHGASIVPSMEPSFITIAEACDRTGKSASTIRRFIKSITDEDDHVDRSAIEPSPKKVAVFKKKDENFTWRIREDLIAIHFNGAQVQEKKSKVEPSDGILNILQHELELKNSQIEKQWEVIHALNDRLREGNMLMGSLQKRLSLPSESSAETVVDATPSQSSKEAVNAGSTSKRRMLWWRK